MAFVLLDTTVLIDVLRGRPGTAARLAAVRTAGDAPHTSAVNVEELVRGLRPPEEAAMATLLGGLQIVALREREGWQAGVWRRAFASRGHTLSQADCLVAAAAMSVGARLATGNPKHFPMQELSVEHWPAGD